MKRRVALLLALALVGCDGGAPMVQSPSKALSDSAAPRCTANDPPPGYRGPVSPHSGACRSEAGGPAMAPAGTHDYSKGQPARVVR